MIHGVLKTGMVAVPGQALLTCQERAECHGPARQRLLGFCRNPGPTACARVLLQPAPLPREVAGEQSQKRAATKSCL